MKALYDKNVVALAVMAKMSNKLRHIDDEGPCDDCTDIAHANGWRLRHCTSWGGDGNETAWYITHKEHGAYVLWEDFKWPI